MFSYVYNFYLRNRQQSLKIKFYSTVFTLDWRNNTKILNSKTLLVTSDPVQICS